MPPTILVMDDDEDVRMIYQWYITKLGFAVEFADDGEDVVQKLADSISNDSPYAAFILDLNIPGRMGGREAVGKIREKDPDAIVIVSSGSDDDPAVADFRAHGFSGKILKPFRVEECRELFSSLGLLPASEVL